jgi:tryptophan synthase alpha chain
MRKVFQEGKALVSFITSGDPSPEATVRFLRALEINSDILELGVPFSDPMADGSTIQRANHRALKAGMKLSKVFDIVEEFKEDSDTPLVLMTYYNPVYVKGEEYFIERANEAGVDGLIVVDLPVEEADNYCKRCWENNVDTIFLAAPNTSDLRLKRVDDVSSGFVYLVSRYGTTGERDDVSELSTDFLKRAKCVCSKPLCVGFGISREDHVRKLVENGADGVVVGSSLVNIIEKHGDSRNTVNKLIKKTEELKKGLDHI